MIRTLVIRDGGFSARIITLVGPCPQVRTSADAKSLTYPYLGSCCCPEYTGRATEPPNVQYDGCNSTPLGSLPVVSSPGQVLSASRLFRPHFKLGNLDGGIRTVRQRLPLFALRMWIPLPTVDSVTTTLRNYSIGYLSCLRALHSVQRRREGSLVVSFPLATESQWHLISRTACGTLVRTILLPIFVSRF